METNLNDYVITLYDLGSKKTLPSYFMLAKLLNEMITELPLIVNFLADENIDIIDKTNFITTLTKGQSDDYFKNWLFILIEDHLISQLSFIIDRFIIYYNDQNNVASGTIWTTKKLTPTDCKKFEVLIGKQLNKTVYLTNKIDEFLLGGIKIEVGYHIWDNTLRSKLLNLQQTLIKQ